MDTASRYWDETDALSVQDYLLRSQWLQFCASYKRLSAGRFSWWPEREDEAVHPMAVHELQLLIWNGDPSSARVAQMWRRIA